MVGIGIGTRRLKTTYYFSGSRALLEARREAREGRFLDAARIYEHAADSRQAHLVAITKPLVRRMQAEALEKHAENIISRADAPSDVIKERALWMLLEAATVYREVHSHRLVDRTMHRAREIMGAMDSISPDLRKKINGEVAVGMACYYTHRGAAQARTDAPRSEVDIAFGAGLFRFTQELDLRAVAVRADGAHRPAHLVPSMLRRRSGSQQL